MVFPSGVFQVPYWTSEKTETVATSVLPPSDSCIRTICACLRRKSPSLYFGYFISANKGAVLLFFFPYSPELNQTNRFIVQATLTSNQQMKLERKYSSIL